MLYLRQNRLSSKSNYLSINKGLSLHFEQRRLGPVCAESFKAATHTFFLSHSRSFSVDSELGKNEEEFT